MPPPKRNFGDDTLRRWLQFIVGMVYLAAVSLVLSVVLQYTFVSTYALVLGVVMVCSVLGLVWISRWAFRANSKVGQFGIGSMMFLMLFAAIYCTIVRVITSRLHELYPMPDTERFQIVGVIGGVIAVTILFSFPFVIRLVDSLLRAAVWFIHRRSVRRLIMALRGKKT